jgi:hypothetical protein
MHRKIEAGRAKLSLESAPKVAAISNGPEPRRTPKEAAAILRVSTSWLAKARMRGDGPAYEKYGRSVRYGKDSLAQYAKSCLRRSTSEK